MTDTAIDPLYVKLKGHGLVELVPEFRALRRAAKLWAAQGISPDTSAIDCIPALMYACSPAGIRDLLTPDEYEAALPMSAHQVGMKLLRMLQDTENPPKAPQISAEANSKPNGTPALPVETAQDLGTG